MWPTQCSQRNQFIQVFISLWPLWKSLCGAVYDITRHSVNILRLNISQYLPLFVGLIIFWSGIAAPLNCLATTYSFVLPPQEGNKNAAMNKGRKERINSTKEK